jgi:hypothetical protein
MADEHEPGPDRERNETQSERLDRNLVELLQELRVAETGVQILFAFLLALPFSQRFTKTTTFERDVYFVTLLLAGVASALFIGPVSWHRLLFRLSEKEEIVYAGNWMALAGLACLAVAIVGVVLLITDFLFGGVAAAIASGALATFIAVLWFSLPLRQRMRARRER